MCSCKENNWVRTWEETQNGRYPASEHAPGCNEYKEEIFINVCYDKICVIVEEFEKQDYRIAGTTFEEITLTRDQFEKITEFQGF